MNYYELLAEMVKRSKLTLKEISEKCAFYGVKITPAYISRLQTGNQAPASDEVNAALAKVCGVDEETFVYLGQIEKAPERLREFVNKMINFFKATIIQSVPDQMRSMMIEQLKNKSDLDLVNAFIETALPRFENNSFITQDTSGNDVKYRVNIFSYSMEDDSMEPRIPKGANLTIDQTDSVNDGDILAVEFEDCTRLIRRYFSQDNKVALISDNINVKPIIIDQTRIKILGRVKSVTIDY